MKRKTLGYILGAVLSATIGVYATLHQRLQNKPVEIEVNQHTLQSNENLPAPIRAIISTLRCTDTHLQGWDFENREVVPEIERRYQKTLEEEGLTAKSESYSALAKFCSGKQFHITLPNDRMFSYTDLGTGEFYVLIGLRDADPTLKDFTPPELSAGDSYLFDYNRDGRVDIALHQDSSNGECSGLMVDRSLLKFFAQDPTKANPKILTASIPQEVFARTLDDVVSNRDYRVKCEGATDL